MTKNGIFYNIRLFYGKEGIIMYLRRNRILAVVVLSLTVFTGCGTGNSYDDYATNENYLDDNSNNKDDKKSDNSSQKGISKEDVKVGVLYISDPNEGSGYSYTHDLGIIGMQENLGLSDKQIERKIVDDGDKKATGKAIKECIDDGCNVIFTTSWGYMETTAAMAEKYPEVYFSHGTGYMSNGKNFNNYFGRIYQARYLSGIAAGMNTKSDKIGYVAAMGADNSEVTGGIDAFAIGVESVNPDATVYVKVTNSWYDPKAEEKASKELLDMGCDVMSQHCDTPYPVSLAQEYGVYAIGYNSDMSKECPDSCLCSVIWNWSAYYTSAVSSIINGKWTGENYYGGMTEGVVELTDVASFAAPGTQDKISKARESILDGSFNVFDGVLKTNTGKKIGEKSKTLEDSVITGGINWYYHNVKVLE